MRTEGGRDATAWAVPLGVLLATLAVGFAFGLWASAWWALLAVGFVCVVLLAQELESRLALRWRGAFQRGLALGFPLSLLLIWELLAGGGILNPRWFPPPSQIAVALWELTVTFDRFNRSSLRGGPASRHSFARATCGRRCRACSAASSSARSRAC